MTFPNSSCFLCVDETINCCYCASLLVKNGKTPGGSQRFLCKTCRTSRVSNRKRRILGNRYDKKIVQLTKEGMGIRSTARVLGISPATVIRKISQIAGRIEFPKMPGQLGRIQVDELHTFVQNKNRGVYVIYSWDQKSKRALSLAIGTRSKTNLRRVVNPLLAAEIESINTDRYSGYKGVVPKKLHTTFKRTNNGIERQNLNLRTHLKRLNRRTICYSKSQEMLEAVLKIYFLFEPKGIL